VGPGNRQSATSRNLCSTCRNSVSRFFCPSSIRHRMPSSTTMHFCRASPHHPPALLPSTPRHRRSPRSSGGVELNRNLEGQQGDSLQGARHVSVPVITPYPRKTNLHSTGETRNKKSGLTKPCERGRPKAAASPASPARPTRCTSSDAPQTTNPDASYLCTYPWYLRIFVVLHNCTKVLGPRKASIVSASPDRGRSEHAGDGLVEV
jgi:hypothetical protein